MPAKFQTIFGEQHNPLFSISFPKACELLSLPFECNIVLRIIVDVYAACRTSNRILPDRSSLTEFLFPLRRPMSEDDRHVLRNMVNISKKRLCIYCLAHSDSDTCFKFKSPSIRLARIRAINFTLYHRGDEQICPSCLVR